MGKFSLVDDEDFEKVEGKRWYVSYHGYACRRNITGNGKREIQRMHWVIKGKPARGFVVDHKNKDGLDNRRKNLRVCTIAQNGMNRGKNKNNTSGYKGVVWFSRDKKWTAQITVNKKNKRLGYFENIKEAALAYNQAAKKYHKEFATLNKII